MAINVFKTVFYIILSNQKHPKIA
jgi:hypothetical protein